MDRVIHKSVKKETYRLTTKKELAIKAIVLEGRGTEIGKKDRIYKKGIIIKIKVSRCQ